MKILSVIVPCYNSQDYMERAIDSLLPGGEDIEIIIIDDGSKDNTPEIADRLEQEHPSIIKVIHKENGGHGSGINYGLKAATGKYMKVVDSDDRVDEKALLEVIEFLKLVEQDGRELDMLLTNYVYDKQGAKHKFVMKCKGIPTEKFLSWNDIKSIRKYHYILMHSIIYRTDILRLCDLELPEHTFYVDNIYAFQPLPFVKKFYYMDVDLYWYFIGREGQSVSEEKLIQQVDQYIRVTKIMAEIYKESRYVTSEKSCLDYMLNYLEMIFAITCNFLNISKDKEAMAKKKALWDDVCEIDPEAEQELKKRLVLVLTNLPGTTGRMISKYGYRLISGLLGLN